MVANSLDSYAALHSALSEQLSSPPPVTSRTCGQEPQPIADPIAGEEVPLQYHDACSAAAARHNALLQLTATTATAVCGWRPDPPTNAPVDPHAAGAASLGDLLAPISRLLEGTPSDADPGCPAADMSRRSSKSTAAPFDRNQQSVHIPNKTEAECVASAVLRQRPWLQQGKPKSRTVADAQANLLLYAEAMQAKRAQNAVEGSTDPFGCGQSVAARRDVRVRGELIVGKGTEGVVVGHGGDAGPGMVAVQFDKRVDQKQRPVAVPPSQLCQSPPRRIAPPEAMAKQDEWRDRSSRDARGAEPPPLPHPPSALELSRPVSSPRTALVPQSMQPTTIDEQLLSEVLAPLTAALAYERDDEDSDLIPLPAQSQPGFAVPLSDDIPPMTGGAAVGSQNRIPVVSVLGGPSRGEIDVAATAIIYNRPYCGDPVPR